MTTEVEMKDAQGVYKLGLIASMILGLVCILVLVYIMTKRGQLDEVRANTTPNPGDPTTVSVISDSYMRPALVLVVLLIVVSLALGIYGAFRVGTLGELTLSSYVLLAVSAAFVFIGFRMLEAVYTITPAKALSVPADVYAAVRSAESLTTAALALVAFYAAVMYFNYVALKGSVKSPAAYPVVAAPAAPAPSAPVGSGVDGGFVDVPGITRYLSSVRGVAASALGAGTA